MKTNKKTLKALEEMGQGILESLNGLYILNDKSIARLPEELSKAHDDFELGMQLLADSLSFLREEVNELNNQQINLLTSQKTVEYYTPSEYIGLVKEVFDPYGIVLDPASCKMAQSWIEAKTWYGPEQEDEALKDGLEMEWKARTIFVNPPYCNRTAIWTEKAMKEFYNQSDSEPKEIIMLVFAKTGYKWFQKLMKQFPICLVDERIKFINEQGNQTGQAKHSSAFVYMGFKPNVFTEAFESIGTIIHPRYA